MDIVAEIVENIWVQRLFWSSIVILVSILIYRIIARFFDRREQKKSKLLVNKKGRTMVRMLKSIARYTIIVLDSLIILQIFGVDISSMLAAAGIASVIIAFAIQDALKDIIRGFDIVSDNYYNVGDIVKIGTTEGKVLAVGLKTTKIQDLATMNIVSIANRNIVEAEVVSGNVYIQVPVPYETKSATTKKAFDEIITKLQKQPNITSAAYQGVSNFSESSLDHQVVITCDPVVRRQARRDALQVIFTTLDAHKISIPYPQMDLHSK